MANVIAKEVGCWIQYQLRLNGLTQKSVADEAGRSVDIVSHFLCGRKDSVRVRTALCKVLGYESFEKLVAGRPRTGKGGVA
jgi:transcriptional regulator with XRE-family HTH domain